MTKRKENEIKLPKLQDKMQTKREIIIMKTVNSIKNRNLGF